MHAAATEAVGDKSCQAVETSTTRQRVAKGSEFGGILVEFRQNALANFSKNEEEDFLLLFAEFAGLQSCRDQVHHSNCEEKVPMDASRSPVIPVIRLFCLLLFAA